MQITNSLCWCRKSSVISVTWECTQNRENFDLSCTRSTSFSVSNPLSWKSDGGFWFFWRPVYLLNIKGISRFSSETPRPQFRTGQPPIRPISCPNRHFFSLCLCYFGRRPKFGVSRPKCKRRVIPGFFAVLIDMANSFEFDSLAHMGKELRNFRCATEVGNGPANWLYSQEVWVLVREGNGSPDKKTSFLLTYSHDRANKETNELQNTNESWLLEHLWPLTSL